MYWRIRALIGEDWVEGYAFSPLDLVAYLVRTLESDPRKINVKRFEDNEQ